MDKVIYVRVDGDNIGDSIELSLLNLDVRAAQGIHNKVQLGIEELIKIIIAEGYNLLMRGSDDVLFSIQGFDFDRNVLLQLKDSFFKTSGFTLSMGVGLSINEALFNLRVAKLSGKNTITSFEQLPK